MPDENTTGIQEPSTPAEATTQPTITGERMPGFGIDYQAPTIVAPDLVVNVPEITLPDRINTSKSPPEKDLPPVNDVLLPTVTPDWFGLRSQSAKTAITHPVLSDIVRRGDKSFEDKTLAINNFDAAVAEDIASKPVLSRNKDAATRKLDADVLIAKSELLNNRMAARRKELFPTYEEQNAFAKAVATGGDNPDAYTDPNQKTYVEEHNKLVKDLIGPGTRSWEAKASDPGGHEVAQYTVKPTASGDAIAFIKTQGALKPAQDTSPLAAILTGVPADQVANPQEDKGWDTHSDVIRFKMPTKEDQFAEQYKTTKRLDELKGEIEAAKNKIEQFSKKPEPTFGSILARATVGFGGGGAPGIDTASAAVMSNQQLLDSLTAEQKNLTKRMSDLTKDGIRVLANERVAEAIKADPKLMSQIPDKGRLEQLITGFRNQAVQMNVLLEQMGVPGYAGSLDAAAELARLDAINGTGGEQSKFRGTLVDELTNITVDSAPGMLMAALTTKGVGGLLSKSLAKAGGLAAGRVLMSGTTYSQSLVSAELTARGMEDSGDHAGAQQLRDSMQAGSLFNGIMEGVGESIFHGDELALLKSWKGSFGKQAARAIRSAAQNTIEEGVTQIGQNWTNPYTSGQPDPGAFSRDTAMAMAAGGVGGFIHQVALAPFNQEKTREENIAAVGKQLEEYAKNLGVNIHETPPEQVDIHSELVTSPADGKTQVQNIRQMIAPSGDQKNWTMGDESWRQRAFQAGVKSEFTSEEEARQFAATAQQQIVTAEFRNSLKETKVAPDLVEPMLNWIGLTIKQQAIANKQDTNTTWARYGYAHQAEILREAERAVTGTSSNPSGGTEQPSPETSPAPETKPSAQNGKEEEEATARRWFVNGVAVDNISALIRDGGGVVEVSQNGRKVGYDKFGLTIEDDTAEVAFVELAASERGKGIGLNAYIALGKELAAKGITLQSSKAQYADGRKLWNKLVQQGLATRGAQGVYKFNFGPNAPSSQGVTQNEEAPAPATADQTAASTEAVNASQESSPPAQEPSLPAAAPVGETSIPATVENATPPNGEVIGGSAAIIGDRTTSGGTLGAVRITFSSKANASTVMHEQIHALGLLESPLADGSTISALESILGKDKSKALYSWAMQGTDDMSPVDAFTRTHERIAEGFEKWLTEGRLPKGKGYLAGAFNSIRVAMRNIVNGMINPDSRFSYIDPKAALPQGVQEAYQQLFSMLENKPVTQSDKPVSVFDSMVKTANSSMNALYPFTVAGEAGRTAMSAKQIADHFAIPADDPERENDPRVVASLAEARVNVQRANAGFTLFQMQGPDQLPNEKAKELIDVALPTVISAQEDGGKGIAGWLQYLKKINSPILNELTPGAREALYQATLLNIPSYEALAAQERIDAAIAAATNNEEVSEADFSRAIESVIPSLSPNIASLVKRIAGNTITGVDRKNALTAVMRAVRVDARSKFNTASNNLTQLLRGYRAGSKNSSHIKDIISEINKVIRPLLNSKEIGKNTKKTIEQTMLFVDFATHGRPEIADIVTMMQRNINSIREDLARNAQAAFIKGARAGGKYENAQFAARQEALIKTIEAELKTVSGMTPARISQVMKTLRGAKSDKALSKATWKALLLFQDQRVRDAYAEVEARQERIKANMKAGKFGELNYLVAEFNNYDPDSIPQHMLAQYSDLARKLSGSEPVILLAGVKNQIEDINDQLDAWLEANPFESKVRAETLRDGFDEAMQRLSALEEFDAAKAARSRDSFITKQQEMGKDLRRAEMAARMIDEHGVFQAFEEADEDELADFSPRQITGLANSFRNYNEGIVTPYLFKQSMALRSQRMQKVWMPMMQHGVRQFLYMKADTPLTEESADLRAGGIMKQLGRRLAGFGQYFGDKPTGKNIRAQFDSHDHLRYDALMGTFNWMNENVVIPMQQAQFAGLKLRNEIMHNKDASGRTMRDYQYIFQGTLEGHEIVKPFLDLTLFSNMVAGKKDIPFLSKLAHTQEAWREMWSRIAGIYMIQRQRESNDMPGTHYADFMANGAPSRKDSQAAINEERRQIAAIKAIRALLDATYQKRKEKAQGGMQKDSRAVDLTSMSAANIREILPPEVKSAIALADTNFGLTGEMTRLLNLFESEAPLPMPVNYFPIHGMDDNMSLKAKVDLLKGPMQDHGVPSTPRADARHARTDERLKFQNADFFGVHQDAVHAAAVDSAMTPFLKLVNMSMNGMMRQKEGEPPAFAGTAGNVVANLRDTMLEYGARYAHAVTTDPGVVRTLKGVALGLIYRMHLPQAFRPLQETLQNLTLLLGSTHAAAFKRGSAEFGKLGLGQDRFWDKVMIDLNAPTAARGTTEATIGLLHASMDDSLSALEGENAHIPGTIEAFFKDASQKPLAERGGVARLQSHRAAQVVKATSDLTVTVAEKAFTHQLWTGVFIKSLEDQTGHAFSRDKMDSYSPEQKQKALAAAELAVTEILAPSARGATRLKAQTPLDETTANIVLKNMVYALTSFTGAISTTAKMSVKAMVEGRAGLMDRTDGARNIAAIVGSGVVGSAISAAILAGVPGLIAGAMAKLHPDDDDDPTNDAENTAKKLADSGAYQRLRKLYHGMWPFDNGVGNTGKFWFNRFMQAAFQSRFGGTDSISRLAAATGAEALNCLGVNLASRMGLGSPYDPYRDNFTQEGIPALTAGTLLAFGSEDPQLRRAFQNSNIMDMSRVLGPISAALAFGVAIKEDAQLISRGLHGEGNMAPAALDALVQIGLLTNTLPLYKTLMQSTKALKDMDSTDFKTYSGGIKDKDAKRLGVDLFYASPESKPAIEAQLEALDDYHYGLAMKENLKLTSFKEAYTVPDDPALSAILKSKLERIRDGSSSQLPERIVAAYIDLEKTSASVAAKTGKDPHYEDELIRSIRYLMLPRKGWEGHFTVPTSQGTPGAEILQAKEIELRKDGQTPVSDALHGMMKWW